MLQRAAMRLHCWWTDHQRQIDRTVGRSARAAGVLRTLWHLVRQ